MPRGDKSSYSDKQKRMAEHIEKVMKNVAFQTTRLSGVLGLP